MSIIWLNTSIWKNRMRLFYLILLLPWVTSFSIFIYLMLLYESFSVELWNDFINIHIVLIPILLIWLVVWVLLQKKIIFSITETQEIARKQNPRIYNIVENLCISRGLPTPKIGIINDQSLNAYATWWSKNNSRIVFSKWLINKLQDDEIEAVAAHELTHIINWDVKNMVIINVFIWAIWTIGYILMKIWNNKMKNPLPLLGLILYIISLVLLPFIHLAISRKKEYLADAWAVDLTKNNQAMIRALQKISKNDDIEAVWENTSSIASMFISNPKKPAKLFTQVRSLFSTHPSIESRINLLKKY